MTASAIRREEIVRLAITAGAANVAELATYFQVTASTIRRDLAALNAQGRLARTYGGALSLVAQSETSLQDRLIEAHQEKRAIARWAAAQVQPGESLLLDAGSTVGAFARQLRFGQDLRVTTTGLTALHELADAPGVQVVCLGGRFRRLSQSFLGPLTESALERMTFDRVFLGADAVTPGKGICEAEPEQTRLKELMAQRTEKAYVLAHGVKLGTAPFHAWARLPLPWTLVTDSTASDENLSAFVAEGVTVVVADGISI